VIYSAVILLFAALALAIAAAPGERDLRRGVFRRGDLAQSIHRVGVLERNGRCVALRVGASLVRLHRAGGSAGAIAGPAFNALFVERIGPSNTVLVACVLIFGAILLGRSAQRLEALTERDVDPDARLSLPVGGRAVDDLKRLVRSPYLLAIAALIVCGQLLGGFMYQEQAKYVEQAYTTLGERAALFARIDFAVSIASLAFQTLVVGWLATRGGLKVRARYGAVVARRLAGSARTRTDRVGADCDAGVPPRGRLRLVQADARDVVHGVESGEQIQEQKV
jgi:hypothetical protein